MQHSKIVLTLFLLLGIAFTGFQCSSSELTSAKLYIQQKNYDKAITVLQQEVQKNPKSDEGWYLLGTVYGEQEQYDKMADAYNKSIGISNKYATDIQNSRKYFWGTLFNKGVTFFQRGAKTTAQDSMKLYYDKAESAFKSAIEIMPDSGSTYKNLAIVYMSEQKYDEATKPLEMLMQKDKSLEAYKYLGGIYYDKAKSLSATDSVKAVEYYNKSITVLEEGRKLYPNDQEILTTLSNAYIGANKIDVAMDAFKAGVDANPDNQYFRYNYGVLLLGANKFEEAVAQFQKATEIDPKYDNAFYNLAVAYVKWGATLQKQSENDKNTTANPEIKKKYEAAVPYIEKVTQLKPDDVAVWELLGKVYTLVGRQDDANKAFSKADELRK